MTKRKNYGFTLVELIVVLVILAVLAALLVPALTGYIDKARQNQVIAETRMLTQAAQTELSALYATDEFQRQNKRSIFTIASKDNKPFSWDYGTQIIGDLKSRYDAIIQLSEVPSLQDGSGSFSIIADKSCKIYYTIYSDGKGHVGLYCAEDGTYAVYKQGSEAHFENLGDNYIDRIICAPVTDETGINVYWSKNMILALLGISSI